MPGLNEVSLSYPWHSPEVIFPVFLLIRLNVFSCYLERHIFCIRFFVASIPAVAVVVDPSGLLAGTSG